MVILPNNPRSDNVSLCRSQQQLVADIIFDSVTRSPSSNLEYNAKDKCRNRLKPRIRHDCKKHIPFWHIDIFTCHNIVKSKRNAQKTDFVHFFFVDFK